MIVGYKNLKRVSIRNEIFIRRDLSILNSINLPCKHELSLECRSGLKLNPDSCKLPLRDVIKLSLICSGHDYAL